MRLSIDNEASEVFSRFRPETLDSAIIWSLAANKRFLNKDEEGPFRTFA